MLNCRDVVGFKIIVYGLTYNKYVYLKFWKRKKKNMHWICGWNLEVALGLGNHLWAQMRDSSQNIFLG